MGRGACVSAAAHAPAGGAPSAAAPKAGVLLPVLGHAGHAVLVLHAATPTASVTPAADTPASPPAAPHAVAAGCTSVLAVLSQGEARLFHSATSPKVYSALNDCVSETIVEAQILTKILNDWICMAAGACPTIAKNVHLQWEAM